jgi:hypothetical protein
VIGAVKKNIEINKKLLTNKTNNQWKKIF